MRINFDNSRGYSINPLSQKLSDLDLFWRDGIVFGPLGSTKEGADCTESGSG
jgi:hypothetical protein